MGLFSGGGGQATPAPEMPQAPRPTEAPKGSKPRRRSMQPTALGEGVMPTAPSAGGFEGKTLIGQ